MYNLCKHVFTLKHKIHYKHICFEKIDWLNYYGYGYVLIVIN